MDLKRPGLRIPRPATLPDRPASKPQLEVVDAIELARIHDADDLGVEVESSPHDTDVVVALGQPEAEPIELGPMVLPRPRSLIPNDILNAIAEEEQALLSHEAEIAHAAAVAEELLVEDEHVDVVSEKVDRQTAFELLTLTEVVRNLPHEAIMDLSEGVVRHHLGDRAHAFSEGDAADSFFVVEEGAVEAVRVSPDSPEVALCHLHQREPFGLFGLLSRGSRAATVRSIGEAQVLEISGAKLDEVIRRYPVARQALARFFKERLLENFLAVSPLFRNLDALGRAALISHFQDRRVVAGDVLLSPGEVQNGITLITSGEILITRRASPGVESELARLKRGEFFGVVSALSGFPTRVSVLASENSTLTHLPQKAFNEFVKGYPVLRTLPSRLHEAGRMVERDVFVGDATSLAG